MPAKKPTTRDTSARPRPKLTRRDHEGRESAEGLTEYLEPAPPSGRKPSAKVLRRRIEETFKRVGSAPERLFAEVDAWAAQVLEDAGPMPADGWAPHSQPWYADAALRELAAYQRHWTRSPVSPIESARWSAVHGARAMLYYRDAAWKRVAEKDAAYSKRRRKRSTEGAKARAEGNRERAGRIYERYAKARDELSKHMDARSIAHHIAGEFNLSGDRVYDIVLAERRRRS